MGWIGTAADGALAYNVTKVDEVCPAERQPDCAPVADRNSKRVEMTIRPKSISQSPVRNQAVVVGTDSAGDDAVIVIALPTRRTDPTPPSRHPDADDRPSTPVETAGDRRRRRASPASTTAPTSARDAAPARGRADGDPIATPTTATPTVSPEPSVAATLAIVSGVKVVGESAAYSPDGAWFAFTARPSDDSAGPDIYVWRVGDQRGRPVTDDHVSVFALVDRRTADREPTGGRARRALRRSRRSHS